ncbi:MAG: sigma-70 family RNA polymerase sigma factor [Phycisphaerales bacterium]|nr:sigma-70 family RNA polymerase sigma factor [Phycisphaerales bacterium]
MADFSAPAAQDEHELIQRCLRGEQGAWDALVERYGRLVYSVPAKMGMTASDADDVFQTVFGIVLRKLDTLRDESRLAAWLIRTTYRECWRNRRRAMQYTPVDEHAAASEPDEAEIEQLERRQIVREALCCLDAKCRRLIEVLFLQAETPDYQAVAVTLNMPIGSIGPTRARCFKKLETILRDKGL